MASVTVVISVHRRVPPYPVVVLLPASLSLFCYCYPVVVLLPASLSLFCYCYYTIIDGFCHSCNICTQKSPSLHWSCPSTRLVCLCSVTTCLLVVSVTVVISVHRRVPLYNVIVLLPASLSLFCHCYYMYMLTDGSCHSCNICTQKSPSLHCSCPSTSQSVLVLLLLLHAY